MQNVKLNHYIAVFERVVLLCKICEQQTKQDGCHAGGETFVFHGASHHDLHAGSGAV